MRITREEIMNTFFAILILSTFIFLSSCQSQVTKEDVNAEMAEAVEAQETAKEETIEALETAEQYHIDKKEKDIKLIKGDIKDLDKQIKNLEKNAESIENAQAKGNLIIAVNNLKLERDKYKMKLEEVESQTLADYSEVMENMKTDLQNSLNTVSSIAQEYELD